LHTDQLQIIDHYRDKADIVEEKISALKRRSFKYAMLRLAGMILFFVSIYFYIKTGFLIFIFSMLASLFGFIWAIVSQSDVDRKQQYEERLLAVYINEINVLSQKSNLYENGAQFVYPHHYHSLDLDIFGEYSLFSLINRCRTHLGILKLSQILSYTPNKEEIDSRKEAIQEMEPLSEWVKIYFAHLFDFKKAQKPITDRVRESLSLDLGYVSSRLLSAYQTIQPYLWIGLGIAYYMDLPSIGSMAIVLFLGNLFVVGHYFKKTTAIQTKLTKVNASLYSIHDAIQHILQQKWESPRIKALTKQHYHQDNRDAKSIYLLHVIINRLDYRLNMFAGTLLNGFLLWDIKVLKQLVKWKSDYEKGIYDLIKLVGEIEAIASLATWAYNHPHYSYPEVKDDYFYLSADKMAHPLIDFEQSVPNDFMINDRDHISIITGSNMSGKSTFLRTLGINMILSYSGTKVAADKFMTSLVQVVTYMRIKDVLEENVSTFKAELNRVKMMLDLLRSHTRCLFLIDEMLRGTNSKDKLEGSIAITKEILEYEGYAIIATHDLKLAEYGDGFPNEVNNFYFDISFEGKDLKFDYKIKEGICTSFNASFLLNQLGLDVEGA
jgi:DNA mismatch repair ATPase MutS